MEKTHENLGDNQENLWEVLRTVLPETILRRDNAKNYLMKSMTAIGE